jgi:two-component system osmolarity sensor histidine kinase EnvZ
MPRLPSQLTLRLTLLLCTLLGANTVGFVELYRYHLRYQLAPSMGNAIAEWIQVVRACDQSLTDEGRRQWLARANQDHSHRIEEVPAGTETVQIPSALFVRLLASATRSLAGDDVVLLVDIPNNQLETYFNSGERRYRLTMAGAALRANDIWPFTWLIAVNFLIVWSCVLFAVWQINKPLQRSAAALASSADKLEEITLPSSAPKEFHLFAQRFNDLARRLAEQERERALLLAGVSHDLRAPLTRIQLRAEFMEDANDASAGGLAVDAQSMRRIIDQFLAYQRGSVEADAALIDLRMAIRDIVQRYRETGHEVRYSGDDSGLVHADPSAIERILSNLIDNALDYGKAPVEVSLAIDAGTARLEVRDHGPGIKAQEIGRLLQPFERLDDSRSLHGHCGLGLSIVSRLVKDLRGMLQIDNHPEGGLRVTVTLPTRQGSI